MENCLSWTWSSKVANWLIKAWMNTVATAVLLYLAFFPHRLSVSKCLLSFKQSLNNIIHHAAVNRKIVLLLCVGVSTVWGLHWVYVKRWSGFDYVSFAVDTAVPMQSATNIHQASGSDVKVEGKKALPACVSSFTLTHSDHGFKEMCKLIPQQTSTQSDSTLKVVFMATSLVDLVQLGSLLASGSGASRTTEEQDDKQRTGNWNPAHLLANAGDCATRVFVNIVFTHNPLCVVFVLSPFAFDWLESDQRPTSSGWAQFASVIGQTCASDTVICQFLLPIEKRYAMVLCKYPTFLC